MARAEKQQRSGPRPLGEQGERTRARLMEAARKVFTERGYPASRVDDITGEAGTSHGAFYLYFANKEAVLEALAADTAAEMYALADQIAEIEPGDEGIALLRAWVERFVDSYERHSPVVSAWIAADTQDGRFDRLGREVLSQFAGRIAHAIEQAIARGHHHRIEPAIASVALVAMLERFCYFWLVRGGDFDRDAVLDTLTSILHQGIFGPHA